jgi:hypothetical protein
MATTTPNYGWPVPTSTDYVKDGATAIEALGDAIDATVFSLGSGLTLVKSQTIGSAVSTVAVTNAFNATYDAYKILITGGTATINASLSFNFTGSTTGYNGAVIYSNWTTGSLAATGNNNTSSWTYFGYYDTGYINACVELQNPFLAKYTILEGSWISISEGATHNGVHKVASSFTGFTLTPSSGTLTGGEIRVYGYEK